MLCRSLALSKYVSALQFESDELSSRLGLHNTCSLLQSYFSSLVLIITFSSSMIRACHWNLVGTVGCGFDSHLEFRNFFEFAKSLNNKPKMIYCV